MTNSLRKNDGRKDGSDYVASSPILGTQASHADSTGAAGEATSVVPRQFSVNEVLTALVSAVAEIESEDKSPTAAGVSARIRQILPGFTPTAAGYSTFRDITQAAEAAGLITATRTVSDFVLATVKADDFRGATLRRDLWRAIQDWTDGANYAFDRFSKKTESFDDALPANAVKVPSIDKETTTRWMRDFVGTQPGAIAVDLEAALREEDPVAAFLKITRDNDSIKRRWSKFLRSRVLETAVAWAAQHEIPRADIFATVAKAPAVSPVQPSEPVVVNEDVDARRRVLSILEAMPLHELLRLPIPLEYALKR